MALPFAYALFAILFEFPLTAAGVAAGAVGVPVLIHLLNRRRFKIVEWAAMRFLIQAQKKNSRRIRLEQIILLLLRCAILVALALAMMAVTPWAEKLWRALNPTGGKGIVSGGTRTHKILVIDGSFSMGVKEKPEEANLFERAREKALAIVAEGSSDGYSVVLMSAPPRRIVPRPSEDGKKVAAELRAMKMTHGNADMAGTFNTIASLLRESPGKYNTREVYFITDMQRAGWISPRPGDLTSALNVFKETGAKTIFVDVGHPENLSNLAVTGLELGDPVATTGSETRILATLYNFGDSRPGVKVRLFVGRAAGDKVEKAQPLREIAEATVDAGRNQQTPVAFVYRFPEPGEYLLQLQVSGDQLTLDDQRSAVVRVRNTVPVLLVNGKQDSEAFNRASEFLKVALDPTKDGERGLPARPKVLTKKQFGEATDLSDYDGVILCDVNEVSNNEAKRLEAHVRRGGALIVCVGGKTDANSYNDVLFRNGEGLLPAKLEGLQRTTAHPGWWYQFSMAEGADREDPLRIFSDPAARQLLTMSHFTAFFRTQPAKASRGVVPRTVLSFVPTASRETKVVKSATPPQGGAAILEWRPPLPGARHGDDKEGQPVALSTRGRVILITTAVNSDFGNWPTSPVYVPLMHELLYYGAAARLRERALYAGDPIELYLSTAGTMEGTVELPRDATEVGAEEEKRKVMTQTLADGTVLRFGETDLSGIYKITFGALPREYYFAVNVPSSSDDQQYSESNLARTNKEELERAYPEWDLQVVTDLTAVEHAKPGETGSEVSYAPQGGPYARILLLAALAMMMLEVLLAWYFGHYSATSKLPVEQVVRSAFWQKISWALPWIGFAFLLLVGAILLHNAVTGDFLSFLPSSVRGKMEAWLGIPPPAVGEGTHWRLEFSHYFHSDKADRWIVGLFVVVAVAGIAFVYWNEGEDVSTRTRVLFLALRVGVLFLMLGVFLPQLKVYFERQGWPDVVILIDDSASMSAYDAYDEGEVREAADELARAGEADMTAEEREALAKAGVGKTTLTKASRLRLAQTFLLQNGDEKLKAMIQKRQVRLHVYRCASRAQRKAEVTQPDELEKASKAIKALKADPSHDSSQLGTSIRQVLNDFRGSSLAAIVTFTDGVTTEGEDIHGVGKYAAQMGVPLFFVGIGNSHEQRDLYLHDLQAEDSVFVKDRIIFEVKVTAQGYKSLTEKVRLYEKGKDTVLDEKDAVIDRESGTVKVRLQHRPTEPGEKVYVIKVPIKADEVDRENNVIEKNVFVHEGKQIRVLYVEGYRRYEYSYVKALLEREANFKGNKSIKLKVVLLDGDRNLHLSDRTVLASMPEPMRDLDTHTDDKDLWAYDLIILGDADPEHPNFGAEHLKNIAEFVGKRGGGLLVLAGERFTPKAYKNTALKNIFPIDLTGERVTEGDGDEGIVDSFKPELTGTGRLHPIFRFAPDEKENEEVWGRLKEFYWFADGYEPKLAAEVLATHPQLKAAGAWGKKGNKHPLVIQQYSEAGRCMFFAFNETWRWNWREDQAHYNQFWLQCVRYLSRSKVGRVELRLDRQTPYRRGEPIKVTVRFPDDEKPPPPNTEVKVQVERKSPGSNPEVRTLKLQKLDGSRATYDTTITQTPEGQYNFKLVEPQVKPVPEATCKVLAPPGEMERLRMNQGEMETAAQATQGRFYNLATAKKLADDLPAGNRVSVNASGPPYVGWNSVLLFLLFLGVIGTEWLLRKLKNLL